MGYLHFKKALLLEERKRTGYKPNMDSSKLKKRCIKSLSKLDWFIIRLAIVNIFTAFT